MFQAPIEERTITAIPIADEEARRWSVPAAALHDPLRHPLRRGMPGYLNMEHFTAGVTDHEEGIEGLNRSVCTQKKSKAQISVAGRLTKVRRPGDGSRSCRMRMYLATVRAETWYPSLASSAWIRH